MNRKKTLVGLPRVDVDNHEPFELRRRMIPLCLPMLPRDMRGLTGPIAVEINHPRVSSAIRRKDDGTMSWAEHIVAATLVMAIVGWIVRLL